MGYSGGIYTRSDGTRTGADIWTQAKVASIKIRSVDHDTHDQDIASALSLCLLKDGTQTVTADLPMAGFKHTGLGDGVAATDSCTVGQAQKGLLHYGGVSTGAAGAFAITVAPVIPALLDGILVTWRAHQASAAGANTLAVGALGAVGLVKPDLSNLDATSIVAGGMNMAMYGSFANKWYLISPPVLGSMANQAASAVAITGGTMTGVTTTGGTLAGSITNNATTTGGTYNSVTAITAANIYLTTRPDYEVTNPSALRTIDVNAAHSSLPEVSSAVGYLLQLVGTIIEDLRTAGLFQ